MIRLSCPECKNLLELDSGFAGGYCRCCQCGHHILVPKSSPSLDDPKPTRPETPLQKEKAHKKPSQPVIQRSMRQWLAVALSLFSAVIAIGCALLMLV